MFSNLTKNIRPHKPFRPLRLFTTVKLPGQRTAAPGVRGWYPSFDLTPPELITGVVTDLGVYAPDRLRDYLSAADIGPFEMVI